MAVRIGVPVPTSADVAYNQACWPEYERAVQAAGGAVVRLKLPLAGESRGEALACAGFILPGSPADVDPACYGQPREPGTATADAAREMCDLLLLEHASATGKPVLAICYGLQRLAVWRGGALVQDVTPIPVNHAAGAGVAVAHTVGVESRSLLGGLLTATEAPLEGGFRRLPVNSSHHQAVAVAGEDLVVVARCLQDGVIEALEGRVGEAVMVGVQWHPERSVASSAASRALFQWVVAEAEDWQMRHEAEVAVGGAE
ncbi:MAG: gamma-glutamyl-gamma-aminobutyrate hydrolase family protein [Rhodospirillales bacterium]|nr:gamma-glutamyl-gamma-aminobutyrate hydrolase family protein [Acetobacter sp.]